MEHLDFRFLTLCQARHNLDGDKTAISKLICCFRWPSSQNIVTSFCLGLPQPSQHNNKILGKYQAHMTVT